MIYREQPSPGYEQLKSMALAFVRRMKVGEEPGAYKKEACESGPSTYGAYHAAVILSLFGELDREGRENLDRWAERINALQCPGGYFSNRPGDAARRRGPDELDPVWHFTRGMLWTLYLLGRKPARTLDFLEPLLNKEAMYRYVKKYDWSNSWAAGNQICALSTAMFALRDFFGVPYVDEVLEYGMFPALEELLDPKTGYWGCQFGADLRNGQFGTIHVLPTYFAQGWDYRYLERSVDSTLACQNPDGSFWPCGSDCPDFDGAYMLYNLHRLTDYRREDVECAARLYVRHAQMHKAADGVGFTIHRRDSRPEQWVSRPHFIWLDGDTSAREEIRDEDPTRDMIMLGSWFYPQSLALMSGLLGDTGFEGPWRLTRACLHECNVDREPGDTSLPNRKEAFHGAL